ncbi:arylsulfatase [Opitutaceae bacterium]|nr:arylsulfatase [Opitutaceae bacterium]
MLRHLIRITCLPAIALATVVYLLLSVAGVTAGRPNIVLIVADDLGYGDVGFHGSDIRTPNLDRLAATGVSLEQFYVAPMCSPTRAGLMTGRYPLRFGLMRAVIPPQRDFGLDPAETLLPEYLRDAGYAHRGIFGKWHLGHAQPKWRPTSQGFTTFEGCLNGAVDYFTQDREGERDWHLDNNPSSRTGYTTDMIGAAAVEFIEQIPTNEPYFAYVPFTAPHSPFQAKPEDLAKYPDRPKGKLRTFAAMVDSMDQAIGRILKTIDNRGDAANTIVIFMSDNGGVNKVGDNGPQRGAKLTVYQGGIRVAAVARWPAGGISGGGVSNARVGYIDILPTLLSAIGYQASPSRPLDGMDVLSAIRGNDSLPDRAWLTYLDQNGDRRERFALNHDNFKLVVQRDAADASETRPSSIELFNIKGDPTESNNLAETDPATLAELNTALDNLMQLKSANQVSRFREGRDGFTAPENWSAR